MAKWVALTVRRLEPGTYDDWRRAWQPDRWEPGMHAYILRNVADPNEIVAFGMVEATREEVDSMREAPEEAEARKARMEPYIESVGADGFYEVIDEVTD